MRRFKNIITKLVVVLDEQIKIYFTLDGLESFSIQEIEGSPDWVGIDEEDYLV